MRKTGSPVIIAYVPVIHRGYLNFFNQNTQAKRLYLLPDSFIDQYRYLVKDIRRLSATEAGAALSGLNLPQSVCVLNLDKLTSQIESGAEILLPDEDICHEFAQKYLVGREIRFASVFLRWDRQKSITEQQIEADTEVSQAEFDQKIMTQAQALAEHSPDWWRQVGSILIKDGQTLLTAHNHPVPAPDQTALEGDPRANFHQGENIYHATAMHSEAEIIASAARQGIATTGCDLYVTTFPCPYCAKLIAYSGIKTLYFCTGYAVTDGQRILRDQGVKIVRVSSMAT